MKDQVFRFVVCLIVTAVLAWLVVRFDQQNADLRAQADLATKQRNVIARDVTDARQDHREILSEVRGLREEVRAVRLRMVGEMAGDGPKTGTEKPTSK